MSGDHTEEKSLPPSDHKLRKAREKGQVSSSSDFVSMLSTVAGVTFLISTWKQIYFLFNGLFNNVVTNFSEPTPAKILGLTLSMIFDVGFLLAPLAALMITIGLVANIIHKKGIPFSLHPIKPDFKKINPAEGLKKLFSKRNAAEIGVSFLRLTTWFAFSFAFIWFSLSAIFSSVNCALGCVIEQGYSLGILIVISAMVLLLVSGLIDLPMQVALFKHEQKMGHKEFKREHKDINGSPEFKNHRKNEHQRMVTAGGGNARSVGASINASGINVEVSADGITGAIGKVSMVMRSRDSLIGIFYHPVEAPVPEVVLRVRGTQAQKRLQESEKLGVPVIADETLVPEIFRTIDLGGTIREKHFEAVAQKMVEVGVIAP